MSVTLELTEKAAAAVRRGHPWVYREGLRRAPRLRSGDPVEIAGPDRARLGAGLFDAASPIAVRVFGHEPIPDVPAMLKRKLERAIERRVALFADQQTDAYRVCNGEGDRVPGLVIDRYASVAVVRTDGEAMARWIDELAPLLEQLLEPLGVRSIARRHATQGARHTEALVGQAPPERIEVQEHGMRMWVDIAQGQKTGAFLDQRENRRRVRDLAHGRVLNLFSYAGGFSVAAALGGATEVVSVDVAAGAHRTAQQNFEANGLTTSAHAFVTSDVAAFLADAERRGERFEVVISDPPSYAHNEKSVRRALIAYRTLHRSASGLVAPGGLFLAASCSSHVPLELFLSTLDDASLGRDDLILRGVYGQPADHPTHPAFPEGRYLKLAELW